MSIYLSPEWRQKLLNAGFPAEELKLGVAEEILRRLPDPLKLLVKGDSATDNLRIMRRKNGDWRVYYKNPSRGGSSHGPRVRCSFENSSLANAAAQMFCHLAENNLLPSA